MRSTAASTPAPTTEWGSYDACIERSVMTQDRINQDNEAKPNEIADLAGQSPGLLEEFVDAITAHLPTLLEHRIAWQFIERGLEENAERETATEIVEQLGIVCKAIGNASVAAMRSAFLAKELNPPSRD